MNEVIAALKKTRICGAIGLGSLVMAEVLPYLTAEFAGFKRSNALFDYTEGKIIMILILITFILAFKDILKKYFPDVDSSDFGKKVFDLKPKLIFLPVVVIALLGIYSVTTLDIDHEYIRFDIGFWLLWIGIIALGIQTFFFHEAEKETGKQNAIVNNQNQQETKEITNANNTSNPTNNSVTEKEQVNGSSVINSPVVTTNQTKTCLNCGNVCDANTNKCSICGHDF